MRGATESRNASYAANHTVRASEVRLLDAQQGVFIPASVSSGWRARPEPPCVKQGDPSSKAQTSTGDGAAMLLRSLAEASVLRPCPPGVSDGWT